ncbi:small metal-binding protein SmbP [Methylomonas rhizoryzae]|uniref:small metal-binding protein SmbP n=1 Tax=Methylomonas rhizoryzae TaxID=2608981 RepID=UPI001E30A43B|nr:small metal-binding protein SmbP [Methylomonas rhizoryzae]
MTIKMAQFTGLFAGIVLTLSSLGTFAAESERHMAQALKHAEAAAKAADGNTIAEHAEAAKTHVKKSMEHLDAGSASLDQAVEHGKQGHADLAKKAAEEAVVHLKSAQ